VILALLLHLAANGFPAPLDELPAVAWVLEVRACGPTEKGGVECRTVLRRNMGSDSACAAATDKLMAALPEFSGAHFGFPEPGAKVEVRASCIIRRGAEIHA
jgi:hypothetical protein